jgi:hypothetical protein
MSLNSVELAWQENKARDRSNAQHNRERKPCYGRISATALFHCGRIFAPQKTPCTASSSHKISAV